MSALTETAEAVDWANGLLTGFVSAVAAGADLAAQLDDLFLQAKNGPGGQGAQSNDEPQQLGEGVLPNGQDPAEEIQRQIGDCPYCLRAVAGGLAGIVSGMLIARGGHDAALKTPVSTQSGIVTGPNTRCLTMTPWETRPEVQRSLRSKTLQ
jgi:hypothetical protein